MRKRLIMIGLLSILLVWLVVPAKADDDCSGKTGEPLYTCLGDQISKLQRDLESSKAATAPLEAELKKLDGQISSIQNQIKAAEQRQNELEISIDRREEDLATQYVLLSKKTREYYKRMRSGGGVAAVFSIISNGEVRRELGFREAAADQDRLLILSLSEEILGLETDKEDLEESKTRLAGLQVSLDKQADFFRGEVAGAKAYQSELSGKIASLSSEQQAIIAARSGSFITSVGSVPIGSDYNASIAGFEANAPSGYFAIFSFGAYTHRKGMSQYGAKARAESGQNYRDILRAYYGKEPVNKDTGGNISVSGYGDLNFEDYYLMGIAEMPSDWHIEALKAQVVAARTYAYRDKVGGTTICTTESCQVFNKSKADNPPDAWKRAVQDTRGQILEDVVTFYASTSGGYLTTMGWDTTDGSAGGDWTTKAWESKAGSPWFYKAWYRQGYSNSSSDCGRKPWMSEEEMTDIINAGLVLKKGEGGGVDTAKILPVTIGSCPIGGQNGSPYSMSELRDKLSSPVTSIIGDPVVVNDGSANTTQVRFQTNRGEIVFTGGEFKEVVNTRAPGYISIPQRDFAFFNIERK